jgi:hypothetical protein
MVAERGTVEYNAAAAMLPSLWIAGLFSPATMALGDTTVDQRIDQLLAPIDEILSNHSWSSHRGLTQHGRPTACSVACWRLDMANFLVSLHHPVRERSA